MTIWAEIDKRIQHFNLKLSDYTVQLGLWPYAVFLVPFPFVTEAVYIFLAWLYTNTIGGEKAKTVFYRTVGVVAAVSLFHYSGLYWSVHPVLGDWSTYTDWMFLHQTINVSFEAFLRNLVMIPLLLIGGILTCTSLLVDISLLILFYWYYVILGPAPVTMAWNLYYSCFKWLALFQAHKFLRRYLGEFSELKRFVWDNIIESTINTHMVREKKDIMELSGKSLGDFADMSDSEFVDEVFHVLENNNVYWKDGLVILNYLREDDKVNAIKTKVRIIDDCNHTFYKVFGDKDE